MSGLLTVEDVNTANITHINEFYEIDTSILGDNEYSNVLFDFCILSHSVSGSTHTFVFKINSDLWCGGYYFKDEDGDYIASDATYSSTDNSLTFTTSEENATLVLYMCSFAISFNAERLTKQLNDVENIIVTHDHIGDTETVEVEDLTNGTTSDVSITLTDGIVTVSSNPHLYILCQIKKSDLIFDVSSATCTVGEINHIALGIDDDFLPSGSLVDEDCLDLKLEYNNQILNVTYDSDVGDYCVDIDLTTKITDSNLKCKLYCNEIDVVNRNVFDCIIDCSYALADTFNNLKSLLLGGSEIIQLSDNFAFTENLIIEHDVYIIGDAKIIQLNNYSISIKSDVNVSWDNTRFSAGNPAFIQQERSNLTLTDCKFELCSISDNYKGSVVSSEYDGLNADCICELNGCTIRNSPHSIYFAGELTIENCQAVFDTWGANIDTDYSMLLNLYDGEVTITGSSFNINFITDDLCTSHLNAGLAMSLISLAEDTRFNGTLSNVLKSDNSLPLTESQYNNTSRLYVKYYDGSNCVISSGLIDSIDKAFCHNIIGSKQLYYNNVETYEVG